MFNINEYMRDHRLSDGRVKRIQCADGFSVSVQASSGTYCLPRTDDKYSNMDYTHVECGFPSAEPEFIMPYAENENAPTETVYGYVPVELVEELINLHNDIKVLDL